MYFDLMYTNKDPELDTEVSNLIKRYLYSDTLDHMQYINCIVGNSKKIKNYIRLTMLFDSLELDIPKDIVEIFYHTLCELNESDALLILEEFGEYPIARIICLSNEIKIPKSKTIKEINFRYIKKKYLITDHKKDYSCRIIIYGDLSNDETFSQGLLLLSDNSVIWKKISDTFKISIEVYIGTI